MRKTKIICTLGPSTDQEGVLRELVANGMNVARFNFSHGSHEEHLGRFEKLKAIREELGKPVAALLDTKGPEIRLKDFKNGTEMLEAGQTFTLTTRDVEGTKEICSITYKDLPQDVQPGGTIMLDDGLIKLQIVTVNDTDIVCKVLNNGKIKNKKGVNVPGVHLSMPYMSQRDRDDIIFGVQQGFDFIAASFVRTAQDVYEIRNLLNEYDSNIRIIAKIENREGVNNIDSILSAADAVMVARGDLGVEIDFTELPGLQTSVIDRSFSFGKPIVTATQMLDSMMVNPRPTRAEISDVANAIYDGTSAIMLSGETAAGAYPVEALKTMSAIADRTETENHARVEYLTEATNGKISVADNLDTAVEIANEIAPEHLEVCVDQPFDYLDKIKNAGSIFLGRNCPEALGDYFAGPNHTLPTSGTARFSSPLSVDDFVKKTQYAYCTRPALEKAQPTVSIFATQEGLTAHARSIDIRFDPAVVGKEIP